MTGQTLTLFVSGESPSSRRARECLVQLQASDLPSGWTVEIVDVLTDPARAEEARILATPTLSYEAAARPLRIVGDMSDRAKVLNFLGIQARDRTA